MANNIIVFGLTIDTKKFTQRLEMARNALQTLVNPLNELIDYRHNLNLFASAGNLSQEQLSKISEKLAMVSESTGIAREQLIGAASDILDATGDITSSTNNLDLLAKIAVGTGSKLEELGIVASGMKNNLGIADNQLKDIFNTIISQGDTGSLPFKAMSSRIKELTTSASQLRVSGGSDIKDFFGFTQIAFKSFGSVDNMNDAIKNFAQKFNEGSIYKNLGVLSYTTRDGIKTKKSFNKFLEDIIIASKGKQQLLIKTFGGPGANLFSKMAEYYAKGGIEGLRKEMQIFQNIPNDVITAKFQNVRINDTRNAMDRFNEVMKSLSETAFIPMLGQFTKELNTLLGDKTRINDLKESLRMLSDVFFDIAKGLGFIAKYTIPWLGIFSNAQSIDEEPKRKTEIAQSIIIERYKKLNEIQKLSMSKKYGLSENLNDTAFVSKLVQKYGLEAGTDASGNLIISANRFKGSDIGNRVGNELTELARNGIKIEMMVNIDKQSGDVGVRTSNKNVTISKNYQSNFWNPRQAQ